MIAYAIIEQRLKSGRELGSTTINTLKYWGY